MDTVSPHAILSEIPREFTPGFRFTIRLSKALPDNVTPDNDYPPDYKNLRKWIHDLPQHNLSLPFPEGKDGRYVKFSCQVQQLVWNNLLSSVCVIAFFFPRWHPKGDFNF